MHKSALFVEQREKKGQKPQKLSDAVYPFKRKKRKENLIDFDPRPETHRQVTPLQINSLLQNLQKISAKNSNGDISMWETQLQTTYDDYSLNEQIADYLKKKVNTLRQNLQPCKLMECKKACNIGKLVCDEASEAAVRAYNFIKSNVWKIDDSGFQSYWMRYGIESEPHAIKKYEGQTNANVYQTAWPLGQSQISVSCVLTGRFSQ